MNNLIFGYHIIFEQKVIYVGIGNKKRCSLNSRRNKHLTSFIKEHGKKNFELIIVADFPDSAKATGWEDEEIVKHNTMFPDGYNLVTSSYGFSEETKNKMSVWQKGIPKSEEHKQKISNALKGTKPTQEHIRKIAEANRGREHSEETKQKMSEWQKGRTLPEEHKQRIRESVIRYYENKKNAV